jgi:pseudouridine-5'-phosphate glycosidase
MPLIEAFTFMIVGAATATVAIIMALVVIGIRNEERDVTMTRRKAPGIAAWLARRILGVYVRKPGPGGGGNADSEEAGRLTGRRR